jgi:hypothetical protein
MDILEAELVKDEYLKTATLTVFAGVPFCSGFGGSLEVGVQN